VTTETPSRRGFAMAILAVSSLVISFGGLVARNIAEADAWQINFYRSVSLLGAILVVLILRYRRQTLSRIRAIGNPGLLGSVLVAVASVAYVQSITHTTVANTLFMLSAIPFVATALAWWILKERPGTATLITMVVAAIGVFVMLAEGLGHGTFFGNGMGLLTAVGFGAYAVIVRRHRDIDMLPTLVVSSLMIMAVSGALRFDDLAVPLGDVLLCFLWGAVLSGFANWMFIIASRYLIAAEATLFMLLEFTFGPLWVWLFVAEVPSSATLAGGTLVISAVAVRALAELRHPRQI